MFVLALAKGNQRMFQSLEPELRLFSKLSSTSFKFAAVNFETEKIENYPDGTLHERTHYTILTSSLLLLASLLPNVSHIIQHEKDADIVLICRGSESWFSLNGFFTELGLSLCRSSDHCQFQRQGSFPSADPA